jgi:DNA helicase-2/ATP-dependent DNA helicase PcrA
LLKVIAGDGKRLWVVGDARQSIYHFRGASSSNMTAFLHEYEGAVKQPGVNYRSTQQIVDTVSAVAPHIRQPFVERIVIPDNPRILQRF